MPLQLGPLHELILYVADMQAQVGFYRDTLGLEVSYPAGLDDYSDQYWVVFNTGQCSLALHAGGEKRLGKMPRNLSLRWKRSHHVEKN